MMYRPEFETQRIPLEPPLKYKLTVNFRSHNQILNLANSIVSIISKIFPFAVDKMGKESARLDGPKPIIINQDCEWLIRELIV